MMQLSREAASAVPRFNYPFAKKLFFAGQCDSDWWRVCTYGLWCCDLCQQV